MTLTAADRCDRCGAQAYVRTRHPLDHGRTTDMLWCGHHAHEHRAMLAGYIVDDERSHPDFPILGMTNVPRATASDAMGTKQDPYRCEWCGMSYVVPSLARECEERHEAMSA